MCPGVMLNRVTSRSALRTLGAGPLAHQQARPRGRSIMVVCRRKARPFVLSAKLGLQENGRPSLKGMAPWPGPCFTACRTVWAYAPETGKPDTSSCRTISPNRRGWRGSGLSSQSSHTPDLTDGEHATEPLNPSLTHVRSVRLATSHGDEATGPSRNPEQRNSDRGHLRNRQVG
jgi:hypothetical protein